MSHNTKDSGKRQQFETGAQRDTDEGKPRYEEIPFRLLDVIQQRYGGSPIHIDAHNPIEVEADADQRHDLIPKIALDRLAALYARGAKKYDDNNWQKGIPTRRVFGSLLRHAFLWFYGDTSEDHLAAVIWNAITLLWTEREIAYGRKDLTLDTRPIMMTRVLWQSGLTNNYVGWWPKEEFGDAAKEVDHYEA